METAALSFERAWVLNALWLLPLAVALFWWAEKRRRSAISRIVAPKLRALLAGNTSPLRRWFRAACILAALALLIAALAGPFLGYDTLEVPHRGRDVVIAVDVSRSMMAQDVPPTRLDRAKLFVEDLVGELGADRLGLVAFAGSAFLQAPLTLDHGAVLAAVDELDTTLIPKGGTNIAAAIGAADEAFGKAEGFYRAVIIVSDGEELSADGVAAAKKAAAQGIRIFTVGVGSPGGAEIPDGAGEFIRDPDTGKIVHSKLDEARMKEIAGATGGFYTRLDDKAAARIAAEGIGKMSEGDIMANTSRRPIERYQWPLGAAIALLMLQAMVGERRRRRAWVTAVALVALLPSAASAAPAGIAAYEQGNYEAARKAFESRLRMEPGSPTLQLDAGTAAYRLKDYDKASQYFSRAALAEDATLRSAAEFNFANTLFRQGEGQQDKAKKITDWKEAVAKYDAALKTRPNYTEAKENKERVEQLIKETEKEQKKEEEQQKQEQKKDQKQDQQKKDQQQQGGDSKDQQQKNQQQKQDQGSGQNSDQQKQEGQNKDQQKQDQQGQKPQDQQGKEQEKKDQQQGEGEEKKDQGQQSPQPQNQGGQGEEKKEEKEGESGKEKKKEEQPQQPGQDRPQSGNKPGEERAPVPQQSGEKKEGELQGAQQSEKEKEPEGKNQAAAAAAEEEQDGKMSEAQARALLRSLQGDEDKVNLLERQNFQDVSKDW